MSERSTKPEESIALYATRQSRSASASRRFNPHLTFRLLLLLLSNHWRRTVRLTGPFGPRLVPFTPVPRGGRLLDRVSRADLDLVSRRGGGAFLAAGIAVLLLQSAPRAGRSSAQVIHVLSRRARRMVGAWSRPVSFPGAKGGNAGPGRGHVGRAAVIDRHDPEFSPASGATGDHDKAARQGMQGVDTRRRERGDRGEAEVKRAPSG